MSEQGAAKAVFLMWMILTATALYQARQGNPGRQGLYRRLWAIGLVALILSVTADFVPEITGPLAILIGLPYFLNLTGALSAKELRAPVSQPARG